MSDRLFLGTRKGLFELGRGRSNWEIRRTWFLGDNVPMLLPDPRDGTIYAALNHGHFGNKLHRLDPGASKFTECVVPAYPPRPADRPLGVTAMGSPEAEWKLGLVWILESAGPDKPGELWAGTVPGGLFHSSDRGSSWTLVESLWNHPDRVKWLAGGMELPGIHSICVDPRDSNRVSIAVSSGGVWITPDGGKSWACRAQGMRAEYMPPQSQFDPNVQDAHRLVQSPSHPKNFWVQHHNGIFRSTDDSTSWQEIASPPAGPPLFGFAVVVHPKNPDTAWFVPAIKDERRIPAEGKVIVSRTRDGGKSFDILRNGLPQEHAYDLVYRHAMDIDATGNKLAFGSTTGSLWTTDDGGEQWTELPNHLPPIYCVRFG
jgi:photosystem II stability/assembly factor-like uncharacterized protein